MNKAGEQPRAPHVPAEDAALERFLHRHHDDSTEQNGHAAATWREDDPDHAAAYARIEAVWGSPAFVEALQEQRKRRSFGRPSTFAMMRMAASVALFALVGLGALRLSGIPLRLPADYATHVGEQRVARMNDGTRLVLDSGAALDVAYSARERRIDVRAGRAFFDVGSDKRPFRVAAGDIIIRDIGTRFSVEHDGNQVLVAVEDGEVGLRPAGKDGEQHLKAGDIGGYRRGFLPTRQLPTDISFAWLDHRLFFTQAPVGEVVDQLRRYHRGWIIIANPALASVKVSGGYDTRDPVAAVEDLARLSGASLGRVSDRVLILR